MNEDPTFYEQMKTNIIYKEKINEEITKNEHQQEANPLVDQFSSILHNVTSNERYKMVIVVREDLKMSRGKIAAQVGHGVLACYKKALKKRPREVEIWEDAHGSAKIVLSVSSENDMINLKNKADEMNIPNYMVRDAGRTEVEAGTATVCAFGPGKNSEIDKITGHLELLKD